MNQDNSYSTRRRNRTKKSNSRAMNLLLHQPYRHIDHSRVKKELNQHGIAILFQTCSMTYFVNIEDVFKRELGSKKISGWRVNDSFWLNERRKQGSSVKHVQEDRAGKTNLSSRTRRVKNKKRILGGNNLRCAIRLNFQVLLVPPSISSFNPSDFTSSSLQNQTVLN